MGKALRRVLIDEEGSEVGRWVLPGHDDAVHSWADYVPQETLFWRRRVWDRMTSGDEVMHTTGAFKRPRS